MNIPNKLTTTILWIARISGALILGFVLFFLIAHLFGDDESDNGFRNKREVISFLSFPVSTFLGLSLAYKWEGLGGMITILGMIGLFVVRSDLLHAPHMAIPIVPGILYTLYWLMTKNQ